MDIAEQLAGEITVVEVKGRIDSNTAKAFGERLTGLINTGRGGSSSTSSRSSTSAAPGFARCWLLAGSPMKQGHTGAVRAVRRTATAVRSRRVHRSVYDLSARATRASPS